MKTKLVSPVLMWLMVAAGIAVVFQVAPAGFVFPRNMFASSLIFPAVAYWLYFFTGALRVNRRAPLSAQKTGRIITTGVYGQVRHPIYSADIVLAWAIFFFYPDARFAVGTLWLTAVLFFWMDLEEKALTQKFGDEYREYKRRVPKMFPKIW